MIEKSQVPSCSSFQSATKAGPEKAESAAATGDEEAAAACPAAAAAPGAAAAMPSPFFNRLLAGKFEAALL